MNALNTTVFLFFLIQFPLKSQSLECINSTSYMDRMLVKPRSSECRMKTALCVKTMQISQHTGESLKEIRTVDTEN
uniref:Secreted protein n=1 Tax=Caenorhabditis tropicalis TaxID=1561998 RepID=A0A1I7TP84_9PELO